VARRKVIIHEGKAPSRAISRPKAKRAYEATAALEKKLREAKNSKEVDCAPDFFTEALVD
jgi:hypothetical protein